ncbi:hypothetical protein D5086_031293 [Populus alba]|uniref:Uncharacterized protein n=1 Tax=Populus alba TaxID=43335 RepID=A0ACC4ARV7_POPAL
MHVGIIMPRASSNANGSGGSVEEKQGEIARKHQQGEGKMVHGFSTESRDCGAREDHGHWVATCNVRQYKNRDPQLHQQDKQTHGGLLRFRYFMWSSLVRESAGGCVSAGKCNSGLIAGSEETSWDKKAIAET